jgi:hypothetical protein
MAPVPAPAANVPISSDDHPSADPSFPHTIRRASIISASNGFLLRESKFVKVEGPRVSVFDAKLCQIGSISDADSFQSGASRRINRVLVQIGPEIKRMVLDRNLRRQSAFACA